MKIIYQTDDGSLYPTEQEALIHEAIGQIDDLYIDAYKIPKIVKGIAERLWVIKIDGRTDLNKATTTTSFIEKLEELEKLGDHL